MRPHLSSTGWPIPPIRLPLWRVFAQLEVQLDVELQLLQVQVASHLR